MDILDNFRHEFQKAPPHLQKDLMKLLVKEVICTPTEITLGVYDDVEELGFRVDEGDGDGEDGGGRRKRGQRRQGRQRW